MKNVTKIKECRSGRKRAVSDDIKEQIDNFLSQNNVSYTLPERKNLVYMSKTDGVALFVSKWYLLRTLKELHGLVRKENEMEDIKFSSLSRYISSKKQYIQIIKKVSCLLPDCENMELLLAWYQ